MFPTHGWCLGHQCCLTKGSVSKKTLNQLHALSFSVCPEGQWSPPSAKDWHGSVAQSPLLAFCCRTSTFLLPKRSLHCQQQTADQAIPLGKSIRKEKGLLKIQMSFSHHSNCSHLQVLHITEYPNKSVTENLCMSYKVNTSI